MRKHGRRGKRRGVSSLILVCAFVITLIAGLYHFAKQIRRSENPSFLIDSGLQVESATSTTILVASFLSAPEDVDSLCVLAASFIGTASCAHREAAIKYTLFVSPRLWKLKEWDVVRARLAMAGWVSFIDVLHESYGYSHVLRGQFLCEAAHATMFRGPVADCSSTQILFLHPQTFVPWGQQGISFTNFCQRIHQDNGPDSVASQFEHDGGVHAVVATCGGETLPLSDDAQSPVAQSVHELERIRWMIITPLRGLSPTTSATMDVKCLSRMSAHHRIHQGFVPVVEAMPKFAAAAAQCDDAHRLLRQINHFVPLISFDGVSSMLATVSVSGGTKFIDDAAELPHCEVELIWFVAAFEELSSFLEIASPNNGEFRSLRGGKPHLKFYGGVLLDVMPVRNITTANMTIVVSEPGASCLNACAGRGLGCAPAALDWWFPNSCGALKSLMPQHDWFCHNEANGALAAVAPCARFHDGYLIVRDPRVTSRNATCAASHPDVERVCTCIHAKLAATAQLRSLNDDDSLRLASTAFWPTNHISTLVTQLTSRNSSCPCPSGPYAATEDAEMVCMEYLADYKNVRSMTAMSNNVKYGRTAKFKLKYNNDCVEAIVKPPQLSFPLEPFAEYIAFEVDRTLGLRLIPPTTWLFVPMSAIEAAAHNVDPSFAQWVSQEVLMHVLQNRLTSVDPKTSAVLVGCSVQLFVRGARWQRGTPLNYDDRSLDLLIPSALRSPPQHALLLLYLSDAMILDTIIANDDRSSQKNSNVFPIGGGQYAFVLLDQGKSLYHPEVRSRYTVCLSETPTMDKRPSAEGTPLCIFRNSTKNALMSLEGSARLSERIKMFVPQQIWKAIGQKRLNWIDYRVERLRGHLSHCVRLLGEDKVSF